VAGPFKLAQIPRDGESHTRGQDLEMGVPPEESKKIWVRVGIEYDLNMEFRALNMGQGHQGTYESAAQTDDHQSMRINNTKWMPLTHRRRPVPSPGQRM